MFETFTGISAVDLERAADSATEKANAWIVKYPAAVIVPLPPCTSETMIGRDGYRATCVMSIFFTFPELKTE